MFSTCGPAVSTKGKEGGGKNQEALGKEIEEVN